MIVTNNYENIRRWIGTWMIVLLKFMLFSTTLIQFATPIASAEDLRRAPEYHNDDVTTNNHQHHHHHNNENDDLNRRQSTGCMSCPVFSNRSTLEEVYDEELKPLILQRGSNKYIAPNTTVLNDYESIVFDMMMTTSTGASSKNSSNCCCDINLRTLIGKYQIGTFVDEENGRTYCIFATTSMEFPWGNVIVDTTTTTMITKHHYHHPKDYHLFVHIRKVMPKQENRGYDYSRERMLNL